MSAELIEFISLCSVTLNPILEIIMRVDMTNTARFVSLEEAEYEEEAEQMHGSHTSVSGSIYSYTDWFYDGDDSAFELH
jgi:DMSO/TMAO reductase YedYZ molybdopterin-dependent catalytic subunit